MPSQSMAELPDIAATANLAAAIGTAIVVLSSSGEGRGADIVDERSHHRSPVGAYSARLVARGSGAKRKGITLHAALRQAILAWLEKAA